MKQIFICLFFIFFTFVFATIINVPGDQPTIQEGINVAVDADTVLVQPGTYVENINYNGKNITVASLFLTTQDTTYISQTIIDGNQNGSVVIFNNGEDSTAVLTGFTITNGNVYEGGGIYCQNNSSPSLQNVTITGNSATFDGGGIFCGNYSSPSLVNVTISGNSADIDGGGIYCEWNSNLNLFNTILINNYAFNCGGGICLIGSSPEIKQSLIEGNSAFDGGGIYCYDNSNPIISNNKINSNIAVVSGGGIYCYNGSVSNIINNEFSYNEALVGGGISILDADPSIINNNFNHNEAVEGGGIHISASSCIIINNTISNNTATYQGGGISITYISSPITINTILWGNEANLSGNEIYIRHYDCEPEFYYCDIQGGLNAFGYGQGASFNGIYENNIDSDPFFLGSGVYPYSLMVDSPCIDEGTLDLPAGIELPEYDLAGNPRIYNNYVDMGAYEWQGTEMDDLQLPIIGLQLKNYPNPFNPVTTISFDINEHETGILTIFNIKGQLIESHRFESGKHNYLWDASNQASGIYLYKLHTDSIIETRKMILLK